MLENNNIWILGFGGIGQALFSLLKEKNNVTILSSKNINDTVSDKANIISDFDYSEESFEKVVEQYCIEDIPDFVFITCGLLYDENNQPEKTITRFQSSWLFKCTEYNVLPTAYFAKYITKKLNRKNKCTLVSFSARVGSIADNKYGGWHSYRMTKVMLNMLTKNISKEWAVKSPESIVISYHPGTVDTDLSKPYHGGLAKEQIFTPTQAAEYCLDVVANLKHEDSGLFFDYAGKKISY